ncbi:hypothetical protein C2845_PM15G10270 [Panicum miliaceum]|uniref:Uncharacterized protein n=1 Tax=Panicum miliaceum TaxID=4540 RepID=A0A3L6Q5Z4_PANMI|nr:hypothetical protein C2845_PM15G10270 [Panicum miliaceum]
MALPAKKVSLSVVVVILLLFSAASLFYIHARSRSYGKIQSTWDDREYEDQFKIYLNFQRTYSKYEPYFVLLRKHPNGEAMDDKDARLRWYESFLPSTLTDSGEPRLLHCHTFDVNRFLARLTRAEALVLADKPGLRSMSPCDLPCHYSAASCGFQTRASTKRSFVRSRPAF